MSLVVFINSNAERFETHNQGLDALRDAIRKFGTLNGMYIANLHLENTGFCHDFVDTIFEDCTFKDTILRNCCFTRCVANNCLFLGDNDLADCIGISITSARDIKKPTPPTNEDIEKKIKAKVFSLPNKNFVKVKATCDFCHRDFYQIMARTRTSRILKSVPNCDKQVCEDCYKNYEIYNKEPGNRTYGYRKAPTMCRTPMDKRNTEILGLEMEFEGDFYGWKELQDAHQGMLHYGYDSSVRGENELSWDCGSYSWWKYLSTLEDVCGTLKEFGGSEGDTAGIHIHVSRPDVCSRDIAVLLNTWCRDGVFRTMMKAVSLRNNKERFERYANLSADANDHHSGISCGRRTDTCEFRVFNSSLDYKLILHHLKFCKEFFGLAAEKTPKDAIMRSFSKETKKHIISCAAIQLDKNFITKTEHDALIRALA